MSVPLLLVLMLINGAPKQTPECTKTKEVNSADPGCYVFRHHVVRVVERDGPAHDIYVSPRKTTMSLVECTKHPGEALIRMENVAFQCMYERLLLLRTAQSAPNTGDVIVVDANTKKVVFRDDSGDLEVGIIDGRLVYWAVAKALENDQYEGHTTGFGCEVREKVSVDLRTKKRTRLGETVKIPVQ